MRETFADFRAKHAVERNNNERIKMQSASEWEKVRAAIMALDGAGGIDGHAFQWVGTLSALTLQDVCAVVPGSRQQSSYAVTFNQRPALPGESYVDESPLAPETWYATAAIEGDQFVWEIKDKNGKRMAVPGLGSDEIADEIAKGLAEYFLKYETANGR